MKANSFKIILAGFLCFSMIFIAAFSSKVSAEVEDSRPPKKYSELEDPKERLLFCIEMLSNGQIKQTMPLSDLQKIFGDQLVELRSLEDGGKLYTVRFEKAVISPGPDFASGFVGWYIRFEMNRSGRLEKYYLSNLHK